MNLLVIQYKREIVLIFLDSDGIVCLSYGRLEKSSQADLLCTKLRLVASVKNDFSFHMLLLG